MTFARDRLARFLMIAASLTTRSFGIIVIRYPDGRVEEFKGTLPFKDYSPGATPAKYDIRNQSAVFFPEGGCNWEESSDAFRNKVVFLSTLDRNCRFPEINRYLSENGATAMVEMSHFVRPGFFHYIHHDGCHHSCSELAYIDWSMRGMKAVLDSWNNHSLDGALVDIIPGHDTFFSDAFESKTWAICFQTLLPVFAFYGFRRAASLFLAESRKANWEKRVSVYISALDGLSMLAFGVALACGQFGPMVFMAPVHWYFFSFLNGPMMISTALLIIITREKSRTLDNRSPERNIWKAHRMTLIAVIIPAFCFEGGLMVVVNITTGITTRFAAQFSFSAITIFALINICTGLYFVRSSFTLGTPLLDYFLSQRTQSHRFSETFARSLFIIQWLGLTGVLIMMNAAILIVAMLHVMAVTTTFHSATFIVLLWVMSALRLSISFFQVRPESFA